jgi:ectoine hydroxylase-related dioxygenase (phytanoyl-CoA dioxygenase family)
MINLEEFNRKGYTVVKNVLSPDEITTLKRKLNKIQKQQINEFSLNKIKTINEQGSVRCPLLYDDYFLDLLTIPQIMEYVESILGDYYILSLQNSIIVEPNKIHHQSFYHRDIIHQNFTSSKPLGVNVYFCLDNYNEKSGGTTFIPGSHLIENFPLNYQEESPKIEAGSVILFNSMIYHKAGHNTSNNYRYGINHMYVLPFIKQQINLPLALNGKHSQDFPLNKILGYLSKEYNDVLDFRQTRYNKLINE